MGESDYGTKKDRHPEKPELKAYIFEDWVFCYVAVVLAHSEEEALELGGDDILRGCELVGIKDLKPGFLAKGGGNG